MKSFAEAGLPVIFSGNNYGYYQSGDNSGETAVQSAIADLQKTEHVYSCGSNQLPELLSSLALEPEIRTETNATLYTTWREDASGGLDYAFLFCDASPCRGNISMATTKKPYYFNPCPHIQRPERHDCVTSPAHRKPDPHHCLRQRRGGKFNRTYSTPPTLLPTSSATLMRARTG